MSEPPEIRIGTVDREKALEALSQHFSEGRLTVPEFDERSACSGLRVDWTAPYDMALDTFSDIVHLAKKIETSSSDMVG